MSCLVCLSACGQTVCEARLPNLSFAEPSLLRVAASAAGGLIANYVVAPQTYLVDPCSLASSPLALAPVGRGRVRFFPAILPLCNFHIKRVPHLKRLTADGRGGSALLDGVFFSSFATRESLFSATSFVRTLLSSAAAAAPYYVACLHYST